MFGAIIGDIIGSVYEGAGLKSKEFDIPGLGDQFTDDSVMTVAMAHALLNGQSWAASARRFGTDYPDAGFGGGFLKWLFTADALPYGSWGNGSAMRVSPVAWAFESEEAVLREAAASAAFSHDHPEGIKGAQATALAIFLARRGCSKAEIRRRVQTMSGYELGRRLDDIRPDYRFEVSCQGSVPEALICFLESTDFEDAIRNAISLGGDTDTQAAIAGSVAEAFYGGVPEALLAHALDLLSPALLETTAAFCLRYRPGALAERVEARFRQVRSVLGKRRRFETSQAADIPDAAIVRVSAEHFGPQYRVLRKQWASLIRAGWTRLCFDLAKVAALSDDDLETIMFVRGSLILNSGCMVIENLAPDLQARLQPGPHYRPIAFTKSRSQSLAVLDEARNKAKIRDFMGHRSLQKVDCQPGTKG